MCCVIVHQHVGVQLTAKACQRTPQALQIALTIIVIQKTGQAIVATLDDMLGDTGKVRTRMASHATQTAQHWPPTKSADPALKRQKLSLTPFSRCQGQISFC